MYPRKIWFKNPRTFVDSPFVFLPNPEMDTVDMLNALMKLALYISLILFAFQKNEKGMFLLFVTIAFTVFIYNIDSVEKGSYTYTKNVNVVRPTEDNPFMNITLDEYSSNKPREIENAYGDCYENEQMKQEVNDAFDTKLHQNTSDIFNKYNSQRQFYTMPVTTIPNKQVELAKWLYKPKGKTCKEGDQSKCATFLSH